MKKHILKTLLSLTVIFFVGCQEDHELHQHEESIIEKIAIDDIPEVTNFLNSQKMLAGRNSDMSILDSISAADVIVIEGENGLKSYTFALTIVEPPTQMTNLVINETTEGFEYFTVTYKSENLETWKQELANNQEPIVEVEISKNSVSNYNSRTIYCETAVTSYTCPSGQHNGDNQGECVYTHDLWSYKVTFLSIPCEDGGGGNTGGSTGTTSPNTGGGGSNYSPLTAFANSLSATQKAWWSNPANATTKIPMITFLIKNNYSNESEDFVEELIDYANLNNNSPEALQEIKNVLDILDDGLLDGQPVIVGPDLPITNMADYLSCFDTSQPATITIYADQPKTGTHNLTSSSEGVGHAFISIKQGTKVRTLGFYPQNSPSSIVPNPLTLQPNDFSSTPGVFGNDQQHSYDVSITVPITATQLSNTINGIISVVQSNPSYNLGSMNCTDSAIIIFESNTNINIPSCESPRLYWSGQTPGTLGQVIRTISLPAGATRNTTGGTAPLNSSN